MTQTIPVFMKVPNREATDAEAMCEIEFGDNIMTLRGDAQMIADVTSGLCHIFQIDINEDAKSEYDFVGQVPLNEDGSMPNAEIKLARVLSKGILCSTVYVKIGKQSMCYGVEKWEPANNVAHGLKQLFGIRQTDKKGKNFAGQISIYDQPQQLAA